MDDLVKITQNIGDANKDQASRALLVQLYAKSVLQQPKVDFSDDPEIKKHQDKINKGLETAQAHANNYLNVIQPQILHSIASISNCYILMNSLPAILPEGSTKDEWIKGLKAIRGNSIGYGNHVQSVVDLVHKLNTELTEDSGNFSGIVHDLNAAVKGNQSILHIKEQMIKSMEDAIEADYAKILFGVVAGDGGFLLATFGVVGTVVTSGAAAGVVVAGIVISVGGFEMLIASTIDAAHLQDKKAELIYEENKLKEEIKLALGISSGYQSFLTKVSKSLEATKEMIETWESLDSWLDEVIDDLEKGVLTENKVRAIYLDATNKSNIKSLITEIENIKNKVSGMDTTTVIAKPGESVGEAAVAAAKAIVARHGDRSEGAMMSLVGIGVGV